MMGLGASVFISIGLPVFLMLFVKFRKKARLNFFFVGAAIYVVSALMLEQLCHALVFGLTRGTIQDNIWLYALYGGLAAAFFEETGRLLAMKHFIRGKKLRMDNTNALMYGIGHGGAESILVVGMTCINNLTTAIMVNTGSIEASLKELDQATKQQAVEGIRQLVETPSVAFYAAGVERVLAIILQIALTLLIYQAVKQNRKEIALIAYGAHFVVDFAAVALGNFLNILQVECIIAFLTAMVGIITYFIWQKYEVKE